MAKKKRTETSPSVVNNEQIIRALTARVVIRARAANPADLGREVEVEGNNLWEKFQNQCRGPLGSCLGRG